MIVTEKMFNGLHTSINYICETFQGSGTVRGKVLEWEKIGEFGEYKAIRQFFTRQLFLLESVLVTHSARSPIFYPPIGSYQPIRQCFTPPKFSHVRYYITLQFHQGICTEFGTLSR